MTDVLLFFLMFVWNFYQSKKYQQLMGIRKELMGHTKKKFLCEKIE